MTFEQLIDERKNEIKYLVQFMTYLPTLKTNVGLSDGAIIELKLKIAARISQCENIISEQKV